MLTPILRELQDWRRWGTDQVRKQLIETAEHLRSDDEIDPQERAKKIQSLREEWRKLATWNQGNNVTLWKTFDSTATAAYEPSKQYFVEQAQQREAHLEQRHAVCAQLEALNTDNRLGKCRLAYPTSRNQPVTQTMERCWNRRSQRLEKHQ